LAVSVAAKPATRQSDKNNFVTIFILSPVVLCARSEACVRDAPMELVSQLLQPSFQLTTGMVRMDLERFFPISAGMVYLLRYV